MQWTGSPLSHPDAKKVMSLNGLLEKQDDAVRKFVEGGTLSYSMTVKFDEKTFSGSCPIECYSIVKNSVNVVLTQRLPDGSLQAVFVSFWWDGTITADVWQIPPDEPVKSHDPSSAHVT